MIFRGIGLGKVRQAEKAVLFMAILLNDQELFEEINSLFQKEFGEILFKTLFQDWNWTDYYKEEMGEGLKRAFIFFKNIIDPSELPEIKLKTNKIEERFSVSNKRRINLDPGYITPSKVVLASTKNYCHRIYLGKGIYAEITLYYKDNSFKPHIFTYRDYATAETISTFNTVRQMIKDLLKAPGTKIKD
ncbi:MAG: DUF4416 family protein [Thermodesulfovibrionales bacterium]